MSGFDDHLRDALRREEPPAGFAGRVLGRAAEEAGHTRVSHPHRGRLLRWSTARRASGNTQSRSPTRAFLRWTTAAALTAAMAGAIQYRLGHERRERARAEAAGEQVMEALRIAGTKLHAVQAKIKGVGS